MRQEIGLGLSRRFYEQTVAPIMTAQFPGVQYAAARIGPGSEVLGYDTEMSADHDFGPTVQIFISTSAFAEVADDIMQVLDTQLPLTFQDWQIRYTSQLRPPRSAGDLGALGSDHGVELYTLNGWCGRYLGRQFDRELSSVEWLSYPEQLFLIVTAGAVFRDDLGELSALRHRLEYFPRDVWLYKIAAQWSRIAEERVYVGRAGEADDELGSRVVAARMVGNLMKLALLIERKYMPYAKWLGTAFSRCDIAETLSPAFARVLSANNWKEREGSLFEACHLLAELQLSRKIPGAVPPRVGNLHSRPFQFVDSVEISDSVREAIGDRALRELPPFGGADQVLGNNYVLAVPKYSEAVMVALLGADQEAR